MQFRRSSSRAYEFIIIYIEKGWISRIYIFIEVKNT